MSLSERTSRVIRGAAGWQPLQITCLAAGRDRAAAIDAGETTEDPAARAEIEVQSRLAAAFEEGLAQGRRQALLEAQEREQQQGLSAQQRWDGILGSLATGVREIESAVADRLLDLTTLLAATIACREISQARDRIEPVLAEAIKLMTGACRRLEVTAHPSDCPAIETWLRPQCGDAHLSIRAEPSMAPGGCVLRADDTTLDATLQTRIRRTLASVGMDNAQAEATIRHALYAEQEATDGATDGATAVQPAEGSPQR